MSNSFEGVIIFIISLLSAFFSSIILLSFLLFKSRLTKQDVYIIQKFLIQFAFFASYLCISVYNSSLEEEQIKIPSMKNQVLCGYLIFIYFINFFINYEHYKSFKDPTYVLRILIKKSKGYLLIDFVILIIIGGYFTLDIFYLHLMNEANEPVYLYIFDSDFDSGWQIIEQITDRKIIFRGKTNTYVPIKELGVSYNLYRQKPKEIQK